MSAVYVYDGNCCLIAVYCAQEFVRKAFAPERQWPTKVPDHNWLHQSDLIASAPQLRTVLCALSGYVALLSVGFVLCYRRSSVTVLVCCSHRHAAARPPRHVCSSRVSRRVAVRPLVLLPCRCSYLVQPAPPSRSSPRLRAAPRTLAPLPRPSQPLLVRQLQSTGQAAAAVSRAMIRQAAAAVLLPRRHRLLGPPRARRAVHSLGRRASRHRRHIRHSRKCCP